jgi:hypothetical protein
MNRLISLVAMFAFSAASAQDFVVPADNITTDGIPPVPAEVAAKVDRYGNYRSASFAEWHPERLEMLITTRFGDTAQVHRVTQPLGMREQLTFFKEPVLGVGEWVVEPDDAEYFTITMDSGGNEFYQIYRFDLATGARTLLTDGTSRHTGGLRSKTTGMLAYQRVDADADGAFTEFWTVDPLAARVRAQERDTARRWLGRDGLVTGRKAVAAARVHLDQPQPDLAAGRRVGRVDSVAAAGKTRMMRFVSAAASSRRTEVVLLCTSDEASEFRELYFAGFRVARIAIHRTFRGTWKIRHVARTANARVHV